MKKPKTAKKEKMSKCLPAEALAKAGGIRGGLKRIKDVPIFCPHFPIFSGAKHREDKMIKKLLFAFLCFMISGGLKLQGAGPGKINYQGRLRESGQPVSGTKSINFKIYDAATVGELKWESTAQAITVSTGIFNYQMTPTGIDWSTGQYWLEIVVGGTSLSPREQLLASAYSLYSDDSDKLDGRQYTAYVSTYNEAQTIGGVKTFTLIPVLPASDPSTDNHAARKAYVDSQATVGSGWTDGGTTVRLTDQGDKIGASTDSGLTFSTNVFVEGNVGIGTTTPAFKLDVYGNARVDGTLQVGAYTLPATDGTSGQVLKTDAVGTLTWSADNTGGGGLTGTTGQVAYFSGTDTAVGTSTLFISTAGNVGIGTTAPGSRFEVVGGSSTFRGSDSNSAIAGFTDAGGNYRVVISTSGNVGIGTTGPTHLIQLAGGAYCDGTGDWIAGSDRSYKKDINYDFKYGLNEVEQLKPVHYVHKQDKDNKKQVGFIAQDILNVLPEVVSGTEGSYGVSYGQITAVLVKAIQEQQNQIKELKDEIEKIRRSQ